ncbi:MAG: nucleotidyl transferase AbiEii/AbiGii toxin family protein [Nitrosarchaeum sp.]
MLNKDDIMKIAGEKKLNPSVVSKDYALGWLLFGISKSSIGDKLIFKGGTALSKVYFPEGWRLSEDLDFTLADEIKLEVLEKALKEEIPKIIIDAIGMKVRLKDRPHANEGFYQSRFQYTGPLGKDTVKIEITKEVIKKADVKKMPTVFDYPAFDVTVYPLEEILAEKMRAILQRKSKKIRDYYDVWRLLKTKKFDREKVKALFLEKCKSKGITFTDVNQFFPDGIVKTLEPYLEIGLTRLSREPMPSLDDMINELRKLLEEFLK